MEALELITEEMKQCSVNNHALGKPKVTVIGKKNDRERLEEEKENKTMEALEIIAEERHILQIALANFW